MDRISDPIRDLPRSDRTPAALRDSQARALEKLQAAAAELDRGVEAIRADRDLSEPAKGRKLAELRQAFVGEHEAAWLELRERGELAGRLLQAYYSPQGIRGRLMASDLDVTAAAISTAAALDAPALYSMAVEAGRTQDPLLASVVLNEARARLAADEIGDGDAAAIVTLAQAVGLPAGELADRSALESAQIAGLEADAVFRAAASGQLSEPIQRLQLERARQAVTGDTARREPPMAPDRLRAELERQKAP
jgi:hypothetical protein